jgi:hypothetical protein
MRRSWRRRSHVGLLAWLVVLALLGSAGAQQRRPIQLEGWIQWISGDRMMLALESGQSVTIELRDVPQDQYMALKPRDRVAVRGVLTSDNRRVAATSIIFTEPGWADQTP